ncbi:MAG: DUF4912 domain-containing protein [Planctomycetota bacterium]
MITTADLKSQTRRELADMAREYGVPGWHGMRKDDLVAEIRKVQRRLRRKAEKPRDSDSKTSSSPTRAKSRAFKSAASGASKLSASKSAASKSGASKTPLTESKAKAAGKRRGKSRSSSSTRPMPEMAAPRVDQKTARIRGQLRRRRETIQRHRDLTTATLVNGSAMSPAADTAQSKTHRDRIVLMVRDSYWLQANWEVTAATVQRVEVSLAEKWHLAQPTLRLLAIGDADNNASESVIRDIAIHGGVDNWYIDVDDPPGRFRVVIGYAVGDDFHAICRSNVVETPRVGECERLDEHWRDIAEDYERIYSLSGGYESDDGDLREIFEQRMSRTMPLRQSSGQTVNDPSLLKQSKLPFAVEAELIVFGKSTPGASVSIAGKPVKTKADGSFTVRMELPDKRQVLPVSAETRDGLQQRTTVIAIERNTKVLEPVSRDELFQ